MATKSRAGGKLAGNTVRLAPKYRGQVGRMFTEDSVTARINAAEPVGLEIVDVKHEDGRVYFTLVAHNTGDITPHVPSEWVVVVLPEEPGAGLTERDRVLAYLRDQADAASGNPGHRLHAPTLDVLADAIRDGKHVP